MCVEYICILSAQNFLICSNGDLQAEVELVLPDPCLPSGLHQLHFNSFIVSSVCHQPNSSAAKCDGRREQGDETCSGRMSTCTRLLLQQCNITRHVITPCVCLQVEAELGLSEKFYHIAVSSFSIGEFVGALIGGFLVIIPFWYIAMGALLCYTVGFLMYAMAMSGWMIIAAKVLSGTFVGLQVVTTYTYFGVSYQHYLEVLGPKKRMKEEAKTTRVKNSLFALASLSGYGGALFGQGLIMVDASGM